MVKNVARRIIDPDASLKQELECCPFITGIEREWLETCLLQMGIQSLQMVDLQMEMRYRAIVWKDAEIEASKKRYDASALESCVLYYRETLPEYQELLKEVHDYGKLSRPVRNKVLHFLLLQGVRHIREIDYGLRQQIEAYLRETNCKKAPEYIKALDRLKPVSYTHLDVYKRQPSYSGGTAPAFDRIP